MFGFGGKNKKNDSANNNQKTVKPTAQADVKKAPTATPMNRAPNRPAAPAAAPNGQTRRPVRNPALASRTASQTPNRAQSKRHPAPIGQQHPAGSKNGQNQRRAAPSAMKAPASGATKVKKPKTPRCPLFTAEGVKQSAFVLVSAMLLAVLLLSLLNGALYAVNHFDFEFGYDVTVKLDDGSEKPQKYTCDSDSVFRERGNEAYVSLTRLSDSLSLSTVGNGKRVKFYKTDDLNNYVSLEDGSRHVIINGQSICLSSPVHITGSQVYVPISFFERYTSSITITYNNGTHVMTVEYEINEALSTPKRKVLEEFRFVVCAPVGVVEMTEEERNEYAGLSKG